MTITLHHCPPLRAWIQVAQCRANGEIARAAQGARSGTPAYTRGVMVRDVCPGCPGVLALRAGTREVGPELELRVSRGTHTPGRRGLAPGSSAPRPRGRRGTTADPVVRVQHRTGNKRVSPPEKYQFGRPPGAR